MVKKMFKKFFSDNMLIKLQYFYHFKKLLNVKDPKTFSEKIQWIKLNGNLKKVTQFVDKYEVRKFIARRIGKEYLIDIYGVYANVEDIDFKSLPNKFVLKNTNGSGENIICKDKTKLNIEEVKNTLNKWINGSFYERTREAQYKNCKNRILIEKYMEDSNGKLYDYKLQCLGGKVRCIQVDIDRFADQKRNFYDCNWNLMNLKKGKIENSTMQVPRPKNLEKMIELSERLSSGIQLMRVDLYNVDGKIYFGELTFTPGNGMSAFYPESEDLRMASYIDLERYSLDALYE